jgi:signal peptidase I
LSPDGFEPALCRRGEGKLSFPGPVLLEFLRAVLDKGVPFRFRANGYSMSPFIRDGDIVTVSPLFDAAPHLGDVVALSHPEIGRLVVHRVVGGKGFSYITKGDNASAEDGWVPKEKILGLVTKVERNGAKVGLGLGPERFLIAILSRRRLLSSTLFSMRGLLRIFPRRCFS